MQFQTVREAKALHMALDLARLDYKEQTCKVKADYGLICKMVAVCRKERSKTWLGRATCAPSQPPLTTLGL